VPASVLVDAGFVVALLVERDTNHAWANLEAVNRPPPWHSCEAAICEVFYLLAASSQSIFLELLRRGAIMSSFRLAESNEAVLTLMQKYADVPMSFADACLVRMTELLPEPVLLTTDNDFRIYRRHSRRAVPCVLPS
jgi:predicted nucleic acid-binding protein